MQKVKSHIFRGRRFRFDWSAIPPTTRCGACGSALKKHLAVFGECDHPTTTDPVIHVDPRWEDRELLDTILHESLHACLPDADEAAVEETAGAIARLLWRLGYRDGEE